MSNHTAPTNESLRLYEVKTMLSIQKQLYSIPVSRQTRDYYDILSKVNQYLHKHCIHNVVHDLIDIDPDRSQSISYCTICGSTL